MKKATTKSVEIIYTRSAWIIFKCRFIYVHAREYSYPDEELHFENQRKRIPERFSSFQAVFWIIGQFYLYTTQSLRVVSPIVPPYVKLCVSDDTF